VEAERIWGLPQNRGNHVMISPVCGMFNLYSGVGIMFSAISCLKPIGGKSRQYCPQIFDLREYIIKALYTNPIQSHETPIPIHCFFAAYYAKRLHADDLSTRRKK